ncbi:Thiamine monophosphate synthase/TENI [Raineyella antarctica]|uniref:Thiamine monophosphate synthase/TENI n=1 Tax=Raineyella antarctica TaxID=1577474 RepID=A0A1G6GE07_9ACTN|nr:thiamine phosphate synthase [Raineyella antarctica]SDB80139.1 Thiamine monophosphate synthase/TENI [Raineyella antarctica]
MTILQPVCQRLSAARLYAVVVPAPFTPPDALVRRVEDLVASGVDILQLDLDGWEHDDAVAVLNRCTPVVVPTGRLLVVGHAPDVAVDLGADALLLGPAQALPGDVPGRLGPQAAIGREVGDEEHLGELLEGRDVSFVVLVGGRAAQVAERAHQLAPLAGPDACADPAAGTRPWFVDIGSHWPDPVAVPERACRIRFEVFVPADSPITEPSPQLRVDIADLASRVAARWEADEALAAERDRLAAENSAASTSFRARTDGGRSGAADPYDTDAVRNYRSSSERAGGERLDWPRPIREFFARAFHRAPAGRGPADGGQDGSDAATHGGVRE